MFSAGVYLKSFYGLTKMDEKRDDALPKVDADLNSDGDINAGTESGDNDANLLTGTSSTITDPFISSVSTEGTEALAVDTNSASEADSLVLGGDTSTSEGDMTTATNADSLISTNSTVVGASPSATPAEEENTREEIKPLEKSSEKDEVAAEPMEVVDVVKTSSEIDSSSAVCELEAELKRLHGGDPEDDIKPDKRSEDSLTLKSLLEDSDPLDEKIKTDRSKADDLTSLVTVKKLEEKPIMKDSDLEEMLSAEDVVKDPVLIKDSQDDIRTTDILVCGRCHEVYHFVEEFQAHKIQKCTAKSAIVPICEGESKPQIWGFTLWKNKQHKMLKTGEAVPSSWSTYQKWCKLAPIDKKAWISAGQTLQYCHKIGSAKVTEIKTKQSLKIEKDPLAIDEFDSNKENSIDNTLLKVTRSVRVPDMVNDLNSNKAIKSTERKGEEFAVERIVAKRFNPKKKIWEYQIKWEHFPSDDNTWEPVTNLTHCKQVVDEFEEQLKKLKAEKAKQQQVAPQPAVVSMLKNRKVPSVVSTPSSSASNYDTTSSRPTRTSKQKALNQVKAWCGNISDDDIPTGLKRKMDEDSDDSFEKRIKYEEFSDDSDMESKPSLPITPKVTPYRKIAPKPAPQAQPIQIIRNGIDKLSPIPSNVLIPDANGVVRINQKQLPSLSTGVYIMSKTAGIIKLDSTTSKVATSGGQTIVKVAPKIGQTQIKIVKKDGTTTATKQIVQKIPGQTTPTKVYKPIITKVKKPTETPKKGQEILKKTPEVVKRISDIMKKNAEIVKRPIIKMSETTPKQTSIKIIKTKEEPKVESSAAEDSDDGMEELPFPDEIKVPEPESPQGDFSLDPFSGKLAGVEYPDVPDPEPIPDPEPTEPAEEAKSDTSLDNIVKLAAADITEEDLKNEPVDVPMELQQSLSTSQDEEDDDGEDEEEEIIRKMPPKKPMAVRTEPTKVSATKTIIRMPIGASQTKPKTSPTSSILNKVLTGTPIIRRQATMPASSPRVQQRILNQSVARSPMASVVRVGNTTYVRKPITSKTRYVTGTTKVIKAQHEGTPKNVYTYSRPVVQSVTRKIGNTTIRSASFGGIPSPVQQTTSRNTLIAQRPIHGTMVSTPRSQTRIIQSNTSVQKLDSPKKQSMIRPHPENKLVMMSKMVTPKSAMQSQQIVASPSPSKPKQVISMPSLLGDDEADSEPSPSGLTKSTTTSPESSPTATAVSNAATIPIVESTSAAGSSSEELQAAAVQSTNGTDSVASTSASTSVTTTDLSSFTLADNENPIFITGDDGTVYQVAGQNEQGQTILLTQGSDGQQQCLLVTSEVAEAMEQATEDQQQQNQQQHSEAAVPDVSENVTEPLSIKTDAEANDQVVAQVVRAEPPSPGGTHKVVVMLPDGNLMVTQVSPEEYASLELE